MRQVIGNYEISIDYDLETEMYECWLSINGGKNYHYINITADKIGSLIARFIEKEAVK